MKKSKLLAGVLVASMALLGTGYAYWTDTLTINTQVKTGHLTVNYTAASETGITGELNETPEVLSDLKIDPGSFPWVINYSGKKWYYYEGNSGANNKDPNEWKQGYELGILLPKWYNKWFTSVPKTTGSAGAAKGETVVIDNSTGHSKPKGVQGAAGYITTATASVAQDDTKQVIIDIQGFYPGSFAATSFTVTNDGTIPAVLDTVEINFDDNDVNSLDDALKVIVVKGSPSSINIDDNLIKTAQPLSEINEIFAELYKNELPLEPTQSIETTLILVLQGEVEAFESSATNTVSDEFNLTFNWIQHNALKTSEKPKKPEQ